MILKSYEIENNIKNIIKFDFILIYGENTGLIEDLKKKIVSINREAEIINLYLEDITKNKDLIIDEVKNVSLFTKEKIIFLNQADEKVLKSFEKIRKGNEKVKIIFIASLLDKRSHLRAIFEKDKYLAVIPCYTDNEITLKKIILSELKDFKNLNSNMINMILNYSNFNRKTIRNNLDKIKTYYDKKILSEDSLDLLLNSDRNEIFEHIRDAAIIGDKAKLSSLLDNFSFSNEDAYLYLNMLNYRLLKVLEIKKNIDENNNIEQTINKMKPPIFWKDKPIFIKMLKKWDKQRLLGAIKYLGKTEEQMKKNSKIDSLTMLKNSITNICTNSWTYF